jgi:hypothetical protein
MQMLREWNDSYCVTFLPSKTLFRYLKCLSIIARTYFLLEYALWIRA